MYPYQWETNDWMIEEKKNFFLPTVTPLVHASYHELPVSKL